MRSRFSCHSHKPEGVYPTRRGVRRCRPSLSPRFLARRKEKRPLACADILRLRPRLQRHLECDFLHSFLLSYWAPGLDLRLEAGNAFGMGLGEIIRFAGVFLEVVQTVRSRVPSVKSAVVGRILAVVAQQ
jgi:hypothetical protein